MNRPRWPNRIMSRTRRILRLLSAVGLAGSMGVIALVLPVPAPSEGHPPDGGYFQTRPAGAWSHLPDDATCADLVHRSSWEPRPENAGPNDTMPDPAQVRRSFEERPRSGAGTYDRRWDSWLLARVTGQHTGTTDENIQWAACKWGLADNLLRAIAIVESTWFQYLVDASGRCVEKRGCGDFFDQTSETSAAYCGGIGKHGHDYEQDYGPGQCPKTFSIVGVMSWQDPAWGPMPGHQNGTFPFNRDSTAFALDYLGGWLRGCMEGWIWWLTGRVTDKTDRLPGCIGTWYAGNWLSTDAKKYLERVRQVMSERTWLHLESR